MMQRLLAIGAVALAAVGCHRPLQPAEPTLEQIHLADEAAFDHLWTSCQEVLRRHRFELDRVDRRSGTITTFPVTSQSFLEFWRHDVDTAFELMEATLRTVRRKAAVQVDRNPAEATARITVTVPRQTFATPERQFNSSSAALRVFGEELPGVRGEPYLTKQDDYWIDDGRDGIMERRLLDRILRRAGL